MPILREVLHSMKNMLREGVKNKKDNHSKYIPKKKKTIKDYSSVKSSRVASNFSLAFNNPFFLKNSVVNK